MFAETNINNNVCIAMHTPHPYIHAWYEHTRAHLSFEIIESLWSNFKCARCRRRAHQIISQIDAMT